MTDAAPSRRARAGMQAARLSWIAAFSAFVILLALLGSRMARGDDPGLARSAQAKPVAAPPPQRVVIRRVERKIIVTRILPPRPVRSAPAAPYVAPSRTAYIPPARPAYTPPPAVVAQPPPPPPAPVVTRQS